MTTIPQRLREIAARLRKPRDGRPWGADDDAADLLDAIAAELEAPAADAAPVVGYLFSRPGISKIDVAPHGGDWERLVRQRDHLATVSALQARINALEARQWFLSDETDDALDDVWSDAADAYSEAAGCLRGHLEWRDRIRAAVRVLISSVPQQDTSKEQP